MSLVVILFLICTKRTIRSFVFVNFTNGDRCHFVFTRARKRKGEREIRLRPHFYLSIRL